MKLSLILDVIARGEQRLRKMTGDVRDLKATVVGNVVVLGERAADRSPYFAVRIT